MNKYNNTNNVSELRKFIHSFNFPNPNWDELPNDFPHVPSDGLTKAEQGMLTGITLAWYIEKGRIVVYKRGIKLSLTMIFLIVTGLYLRFITTSPGFTTVKEVSAATVSAGIKKLTTQRNNNFGEILESTMSARVKLNDTNKTNNDK